MRVAIVIPSYNHARYIARALDSCLSQTRPAQRIIVLDDGSLDDSVEIIRSYAARGVEHVTQGNRGAHAAVNQLVDMASVDCDVISILNSDDHYAPDRLAKCLPLLDAGDGAAVVCSGVKVIDECDAPLPAEAPRAKWFRAAWSWSSLAERDLVEWLALANFPATSSNIIGRTDFLRRHPFKPHRYCHDYAFLVQAGLRGALTLHSEALINYRVHATNTMNTNPEPLLRDSILMHLHLLRDLAPELQDDEALRRRLYDYSRMAWDNISSFHAGLFQVALAGLIMEANDEVLAAAVQGLSAARLPELQRYPNRASVNLWDEAAPLGRTPTLAEKYDALKRENKLLKAENKSWGEAARLWARAAGSRRRAMQLLLGWWKPPCAKTPPEAQIRSLREPRL